MTNEEKGLLEDLEVWRHATLAKVYASDYLTVKDGKVADTIEICQVASGRFSRTSTEPEMKKAIDGVRNAISALEEARNAIIERKLRELRIAGMR